MSVEWIVHLFKIEIIFKNYENLFSTKLLTFLRSESWSRLQRHSSVRKLISDRKFNFCAASSKRRSTECDSISITLSNCLSLKTEKILIRRKKNLILKSELQNIYFKNAFIAMSCGLSDQIVNTSFHIYVFTFINTRHWYHICFAKWD